MKHSEQDNEEEKIDKEEDTVYKDNNQDELTIEMDENAGETVKKLRKKLQLCEKERQEFLDGWQRARADYLNQRQASAEQLKASLIRQKNSLIEQLIPLADSFEMAFKDAGRWEAVDPVWRKGIENIYAQLEKIFNHFGVKQINPKGLMFSPTEHECVELIESDEKAKDNTVAEVLQCGYKRENYVIRPARVKVFQHTPPKKNI